MNATPHRKTLTDRRPWLALAPGRKGVMMAGLLWALTNWAAAAGLPDLLGKAQPPLPKGALQVQDLEADPKGYTGRILVRGVVAKASPNDPQLYAVIDSREARVCKDLHCAKFYLPVRVQGANLKPWDEIDVRGTMAEDTGRKLVYLLADEVKNLGPIKR